MTEKIYNILDFCTGFINEIDDFEDVQLATDFSCFPNSNEIYVAVLASQIEVDAFRNNLYTRTNVRDISEFTWSLLHEVGHCMTWNSMNERTINHCRNVKRKIVRGSIPKPVYYTLTDERIATDWAIRYVERNLDMVRNFDKQIIEMLNTFYSETLE